MSSVKFGAVRDIVSEAGTRQVAEISIGGKFTGYRLVMTEVGGYLIERYAASSEWVHQGNGGWNLEQRPAGIWEMVGVTCETGQEAVLQICQWSLRDADSAVSAGAVK